MILNRRIFIVVYREIYCIIFLLQYIECFGVRELGSRDIFQEVILVKIRRNENLNYGDDEKVKDIYKRNCRVEVINF